jgi:hypothetical protein
MNFGSREKRRMANAQNRMKTACSANLWHRDTGVVETLGSGRCPQAGLVQTTSEKAKRKPPLPGSPQNKGRMFHCVTDSCPGPHCLRIMSKHHHPMLLSSGIFQDPREKQDREKENSRQSRRQKSGKKDNRNRGGQREQQSHRDRQISTHRQGQTDTLRGDMHRKRTDADRGCAGVERQNAGGSSSHCIHLTDWGAEPREGWHPEQSHTGRSGRSSPWTEVAEA